MKIKAAEGVLFSMGAASMTGNVVATWGNPKEMIIGGAFPLAIALAEWLAHDPRAKGWMIKAGIAFVTVAAIVWSFTHLAELVSGTWMRWLIPCTIDVLFVISMQMVLSGHKARSEPAPEVVERVVEVEKVVYVEVPAAPVPAPAPEVLHVEAEVQEAVTETETETVTRTRTVTSGRRSSLTIEQREQIVELGLAGHKPAEILRKLGIEGKQTNFITRSPEWSRVLELRG